MKKKINYNNKSENTKRVQYDYDVGHYTYILRDGNFHKPEGDIFVLFRITQMHTNGPIRIQIGISNEKINIRRLTPYFGDTPK